MQNTGSADSSGQFCRPNHPNIFPVHSTRNVIIIVIESASAHALRSGFIAEHSSLNRIISPWRIFGTEKKMSQEIYRKQWPDGLYTDCYVHQVMNFRYHWHPDTFEINILLKGKQHFYQGTDIYDLEENDAVLINPNVGHASYCDPEGTIAFVLHIPAAEINQFAGPGQKLVITGCLSDAKTRDKQAYRHIRKYAAEILYGLHLGDPVSVYDARASLQKLVGTLCSCFETRTSESPQQTDETTQKIIRSVLDHIETNWSEKITLEDIAAITGYNRTYISTLFGQTVGIRFYDYLTRLRLQHAIRDLVTTDKSLTDIALGNGFPDLKTFNTRFRDMLKILPSEYRSRIEENTIAPEYYEIQSIPFNDPLIEKKLMEYMQI